MPIYYNKKKDKYIIICNLCKEELAQAIGSSSFIDLGITLRDIKAQGFIWYNRAVVTCVACYNDKIKEKEEENAS